MVIQNNIKKSFVLLLLLAACTSNDEEWPSSGKYAVLSPRIQMEGSKTRTVIIGTDANPGTNQINQVQLFITRNADSHTVYPNTESGWNGLSVYELTSGTSGGSNEWKGTPAVNLSSDMARIFAFYPPIKTDDSNMGFIPSNADEKHKIKVTVPASQTFDGTNDWDCTATDYLYGSASGEVGVASPITANNAAETADKKPFSPEISMQHALSLLVFTLQSKSGRDVDQIYDYVKEIRLSTTDATNQFRVSGAADKNTMQINDGTLALDNSPTLTLTATAGTARLCGIAGSPEPVAYGLVAPLEREPSDLKLTVVLDKKDATTSDKRELSVTLPPKAWQKGNRYKFNLTLTDREIAVESTEISTWGNGWEGDDSQGDGSLYPDGYESSKGI